MRPQARCPACRTAPTRTTRPPTGSSRPRQRPVLRTSQRPMTSLRRSRVRPSAPGAGALAASQPLLELRELALQVEVASPPLRVEAPRPRAPPGSRSRAPPRAGNRRTYIASRARRRLSNASSSPSSATQRWSSRMPGLSTIDPSAGEDDELAPGRRVPARAVVPQRPGGEELLAGEGVHERRLTDARRSQKGSGHARPEVRADDVESETAPRRDRVDGDRAADLGDLGCDLVRVGFEVRLRQQDDRPCAALPGERQVALEEARGSARPRGRRR